MSDKKKVVANRLRTLADLYEERGEFDQGDLAELGRLGLFADSTQLDDKKDKQKMSRGEFDKLRPEQKMAHVKAGGTLTD